MNIHHYFLLSVQLPVHELEPSETLRDCGKPMFRPQCSKHADDRQRNREIPMKEQETQEQEERYEKQKEMIEQKR